MGFDTGAEAAAVRGARSDVASGIRLSLKADRAVGSGHQDEPHGFSDEQLFRWAADHDRCIVTENVKDFAPLARQVDESREHATNLLFTSSRTFPRARRNPGPIIEALVAWLDAAGSSDPPVEDWLQLAATET